MPIMRPETRWATTKAAAIVMGLAMASWAAGPTMAQAETVQVSQSTTCLSGGADDLNRWPLRGRDFSSCVKKGEKAPTLVRRHAQESALNLWPYGAAAPPQKGELVKDTPNGEEKVESMTSVRTEPDLRMWPLWPKP